MSYLYNQYAWYIGEGTGPRSVSVEPTNKSISETVGELRSMWGDKAWVEVPYYAPDTTGELNELKQEKINLIVNMQYRKSDSTINFSGMTINTNFDALTELMAALDGMRRGKKSTRKVNLRTGRTVLDAATLELIVDAVDDYRQSVQDTAYDLSGLIQSASTFEEVEAIDINEGWP